MVNVGGTDPVQRVIDGEVLIEGRVVLVGLEGRDQSEGRQVGGGVEFGEVAGATVAEEGHDAMTRAQETSHFDGTDAIDRGG